MSGDIDCSDEPLDYLPGKYIIIDSLQEIKPGKNAKRAYSLFNLTDQSFSLAAYTLPNGPGSNYLNQLSKGDQIQFSGSWE